MQNLGWELLHPSSLFEGNRATEHLKCTCMYCSAHSLGQSLLHSDYNWTCKCNPLTAHLCNNTCLKAIVIPDLDQKSVMEFSPLSHTYYDLKANFISDAFPLQKTRVNPAVLP